MSTQLGGTGRAPRLMRYMQQKLNYTLKVMVDLAGGPLRRLHEQGSLATRRKVACCAGCSDTSSASKRACASAEGRPALMQEGLEDSMARYVEAVKAGEAPRRSKYVVEEGFPSVFTFSPPRSKD